MTSPSRSVLTSDVSSVSDIGSPPRKGVRRVLRAGEKLRAAFEDFANDVHEAYTFDLNPEYRLKIVKKFDGLSIGARFDFPSGDCRIKAKRAPSATPGGGSRFWRWFKRWRCSPRLGMSRCSPDRSKVGACSRCRASEGSRDAAEV